MSNPKCFICCRCHKESRYTQSKPILLFEMITQDTRETRDYRCTNCDEVNTFRKSRSEWDAVDAWLGE